MGIIQTQPYGLMKPSARIRARNAHLIPEIYLRASRILQSAKEETIMANSVVRRMAELWTKIRTGRKCSCCQDVDTFNQSKAQHKGVPDIAEFIKSGNLRILNEKEFCPICYGTEFVGGYNLLGTTSVVLDASHPNISLKGNVSIKQGSPYTILCGNSGTVSWTIDLPKYFLSIHTIVLHWYPKPPEDFSLLINDKPFDMDLFNILGQTSRKEKTKISVKINDASGKIQLYYIRFILKTTRNTLISVDIPNYTYSYSGELQVHNECQSTITANFDGQHGKIGTSDIFVLEDDGIIWRVIENEYNTPMGVNISNNTQARLVRSFENYYTIPSKLALKAYPLPNYTFIY